MFRWFLLINRWRTQATLINCKLRKNMNLNDHFFIYLEALTFILLSTMFVLLYKSNKCFQRSRALSKKDDWIIYMKYLLLVTVLLGLSTPSEAVTTRMFKVLDTCARYRLKEKTALVAIKTSNSNMRVKMRVRRSYSSNCIARFLLQTKM